MVGKRRNVGSRRLAHDYIWPFHYHAIRLASKLQSTSLFAEAIGDVCALVGVEAPVFVPSRWTLQRWEVKLDCACMMYQRRIIKKEVSNGVTARRSLSADSSPQVGYNFFCVREEICCIANGEAPRLHVAQLARPHARSAPLEVH